MQVTRAGGPGHGKFARIEHSIEFVGERAENSMPRPETSDQTALGTRGSPSGVFPSPGAWPSLKQVLGLQLFFVAIAAVIYGIFWAIRPESSNLLVTVVYTLCLSNLTAFTLSSLSSLYAPKPPLQYWYAFLGLLLFLTPVMVTATTALVFWFVDRPGGRFWPYLSSGWKFPCLATITFGVACQIYLVTKGKLEQRNRELQQVIASDIAEHEVQEEELERAREIQEALLPKVIPQVNGFQIAATWEPARTVGGDYFDVIPLAKQKLGICIADVVGKSVPAALLMANVQASVRAFASESASPAWLCDRVNAVLCANLVPEKFVTLFYGVLDAEKKTVEYTCAGHPPPLLKRASGSVQLMENGGAVLGMFPHWQYENSLVQLAPGDRLLLFTDGITEACKADGEQLGEERLMHLLEKLAAEPPPALNRRLLESVKSFGGSHLQDDVTLIAIAVDAASQATKQERGSSRVAAL